MFGWSILVLLQLWTMNGFLDEHLEDGVCGGGDVGKGLDDYLVADFYVVVDNDACADYCIVSYDCVLVDDPLVLGLDAVAEFCGGSFILLYGGPSVLISQIWLRPNS